MAHFLSSPEHYASVYRPVLYTIAADNDGSTLDVDLVHNNTVLGRKRFRSAPEIEVDAAPYFLRLFDPQPLPVAPFEFYNPHGRVVVGNARIGEVNSEFSLFTASTKPMNVGQLLSDYTSTRRISLDDCDEISILVDNTTVTPTLCIHHVSGDVYFDAEEQQLEEGMWTLLINMADISQRLLAMQRHPSGCYAAEARIDIDGRPAITVDYTIAPRPQKSQRLCWVNSYGAIDYFTFDSIAAKRVESTKQRIRSIDGYRTVDTLTDSITTLLCPVQRGATFEALSELVSSPRVWRIDSDGATEIDILSNSLRNLTGIQASFTIDYRQKNRCQVLNF